MGWKEFSQIRSTCLIPGIGQHLSYGVAVIQWITSCHKNHITTRVIGTLWRVDVTPLTTSVSTMLFLLK